ncbi:MULTISPECIES: Trk system potassium transporter TrkA [Methanosarcina]|uniref:Trk system potassium uptake protein TrkA n=3 Tax=Methanosarcina barkeri TaxID=2208 RepID=A0A0E3QSK9_METBA|nr:MULTISPECIES: Trk system potassium transporter TrkA [Methanosarcina]AKB54245.1 Trk system potassium uptake protein TrkA [Methanosarcina barkeri MS]AKB57678.1 Trk system potassium uptake protein TrkA [Methanosarcina barkeri 227]AKJ38226.1 potassium uptake protein TrkA1 [Methanosarcina barkeri CM1]OEC90425.1 Trk system potassium transport protein TrkA [Methanosarcina sp. A14]
MKAIVIGAGEVGYHIAKFLSATHDVIVVEKDEDVARRVDELDVQVLEGNGANADILASIIHDADILVAVTGIDEVNIVACMTAKLIIRSHSGWKETKTIARVSNPDYIDVPVTSRSQVGVDIMICPELALASEVAEVLSSPSAIDAEVFAGGKVQMMEFAIRPDSKFVGKQIQDLKLDECCIVSAIFRKQEIIIPHGDDIINANDHMVVVGKPRALEELGRIFGNVEPHRNRILLIGCGIVGFYLAELIDKDENADLKIIEYNKSRCMEVAEMLENALILNGDGTDVNLLREENIEDMDVVLAVTNNDEKNLLCSLLAKQMGARKVIARADRPDYIPLFEMIGIDMAVSPREATVNEVLKLTMGTGIEKLTMLEGEKAEIIEYTTSRYSKIIGKSLEKVKFPKDAIVTTIVHNDDIIIPRGDSVIREGDRVIVFALSSAVSAVEKYFK